MSRVLNMPKFWIWQSSEYGRVPDMPPLHSVLNMPEYALISSQCSVNMVGFWIWQVYEYARVLQGFKYGTLWLNMSEKDVNMPEYVWIIINRQGSEYVSYNTWWNVTLQINEYLLRYRCIPNLVKDLIWSALEK